MAAHTKGEGSKFCVKYNIKHLLYVEEHPTLAQAIAREKQLKNWHRPWKWNLISEANPLFTDLISGENLVKAKHNESGSAGDAETSSA